MYICRGEDVSRKGEIRNKKVFEHMRHKTPKEDIQNQIYSTNVIIVNSCNVPSRVGNAKDTKVRET